MASDGRWDKLTSDILERISDRLPFPDLLSFRAVCRGWRYAPSGRAAIFRLPRDGLWCIVYDHFGNCALYHPLNPVPCTFRLPDIAGARCLASKHGWVLALRSGNLFLSKLWLPSTITLPVHPSWKKIASSHVVGTLMYNPTTCADCTVFMAMIKEVKPNVEVVELSWCRPREGSRWNTKIICKYESSLIGAQLSYLTCCCCEDKTRCKCTLKDFLLIFGNLRGNYFVRYNMVDKKSWTMRWIMRLKLMRHKDNLINELVEHHAEDLRRRIDKEGFKLRTCDDDLPGTAKLSNNRSSLDDFKSSKVEMLEQLRGMGLGAFLCDHWLHLPPPML